MEVPPEDRELIARDIEGYLRKYEDKDLLRFLTAGSVDDGKSTLIGRLLYDTQSIYDDQLAAIQRDSARHGSAGDATDLALLTDGLKAEREQGITIDVAYRFFSTARRKCSARWRVASCEVSLPSRRRRWMERRSASNRGRGE